VDKLVDQIRRGGIFMEASDVATLLLQAQLYKNNNKNNWLCGYAGSAAGCRSQA
jgi:hypothetical protein